MAPKKATKPSGGVEKRKAASKVLTTHHGNAVNDLGALHHASPKTNDLGRATPCNPWISMYLQATASSAAGSKDDKPAAKAKKGALAIGDHLPDFSVETDALH